EFGGRRQKTEHEEHDDLRKPRHPLLITAEAVASHDRAVSRKHARDINREKAASSQQTGQGKQHERRTDDRDGIERVLEPHPVDDLHDQKATEKTEQKAETHLLAE